MPNLLRNVFIIIGLIVIGGGIFAAINYISPANPSEEIALPALNTPTPMKTATPTKNTPTPVAIAAAITATATETSTPHRPTATPTPEDSLPRGGIVYALSPDINSVGWVQANEDGNHFGESYLYAGIREGVIHSGAMQFDLTFLPKGSTIFGAELELTGLNDEGLTEDNLFEINILTEEIDPQWSRHNFETISKAQADETLTPTLKASLLNPGQSNTLIFNAAQRSIIEDRLGTTHLVSFRIDTLFEEGWFAWDSGYGRQSDGQGPVLRLGVLPPVATSEAAAPPNSTPTPTPTFIVITSTPTPENLSTAAAMAPTATYEATTIGTPTPLPQNWVTPLVVTNTPVPANAATAQYLQVEATNAVIAFGTSTPTPQNLVTATSTPTETPTPVLILLEEGGLPPMTPTPTIAATREPPPPVPAQLIGKIAFKSDRAGDVHIYVMNPDGSNIAVLTARWPYNVAEQADVYSADGRFRVFTKDTVRYIDTGLIDPNQEPIYRATNFPTLFWRDALYNDEEQLTHFGAGMAYAGVWSPTREQIAFVSNDSSDDEIWIANHDGSDIRQLTESNEAYNAQQIGKDTFIPEVNRHPSWSPDGNQITFWSNRSGHGQIWVMNADGSNPVNLSNSNYNDWDPVWIKYPSFPPDALVNHFMLYSGPYEPSGLDKDCQDFSSQHEALQFYYSAGGPFRDPHELDRDNDGLVCEIDGQ